MIHLFLPLSLHLVLGTVALLSAPWQDQLTCLHHGAVSGRLLALSRLFLG